MMKAVGTKRVSRRSRRLAAIGSVLGLAISLALTLRLMQVHVLRPGGTPIFGLLYSSMLLAPFVASIAALKKSSGRLQTNVWGVSGMVSLALAFTSLAGVTLPLLIPSGFLLAAAAPWSGE